MGRVHRAKSTITHFLRREQSTLLNNQEYKKESGGQYCKSMCTYGTLQHSHIMVLRWWHAGSSILGLLLHAVYCATLRSSGGIKLSTNLGFIKRSFLEIFFGSLNFFKILGWRPVTHIFCRFMVQLSRWRILSDILKLTSRTF